MLNRLSAHGTVRLWILIRVSEEVAWSFGLCEFDFVCPVIFSGPFEVEQRLGCEFAHGERRVGWSGGEGMCDMEAVERRRDVCDATVDSRCRVRSG